MNIFIASEGLPKDVIRMSPVTHKNDYISFKFINNNENWKIVRTFVELEEVLISQGNFIQTISLGPSIKRSESEPVTRSLHYKLKKLDKSNLSNEELKDYISSFIHLNSYFHIRFILHSYGEKKV